MNKGTEYRSLPGLGLTTLKSTNNDVSDLNRSTPPDFGEVWALVLDRLAVSNIIEVTGAPGSGKTTFIRSHFAGARVLWAFPELSGVVPKALYSIFMFLWILVTGAITIQQLWWLIRKTHQYNEKLIFKLNAFRNCVLKFGYRFYETEGGFVVIDEGIAHIPFILELQKPKDIDEFITLFHQHLSHAIILFIEAPAGEKTLFERLYVRGHVRIETADETAAFIDRNSRVAVLYKEALQRANIEVTLIK